MHSHLKNGSEKVSALIFFLVSEIWAKLKKLVSVEHVAQNQKYPKKVKQMELTELIFLYLVDQVHWGHCQIQAPVSPLLLLSPVTESFRHDVDDPHMLMLALEKR